MAGKSRIGIVTVTFNSESVIDDFLASLSTQEHADFILYVVDNDSKDKTLEKLHAQWGADERCVVIRNDKNLGIAVGNNMGIRRAQEDGCDYILLLNNDTVFESDLLSGMLKAAESLKAPMLVPKIMFAEPADTIWCAGGKFVPWRGYATAHCGEGEPDRGQYDQARRIGYAPTCCMLIRREVFDTVGLMDERYFVYYDDVDFCYRALKAGVTLWYAPTPRLQHKVSSLTGGSYSPFSVTQLTRGKVIFMRKHFSSISSGLLLGLYQLVFFRRILSPSYGRGAYKLSRAAFRDGMNVKLP